MESNDKKSKRPRIGSNRPAGMEDTGNQHTNFQEKQSAEGGYGNDNFRADDGNAESGNTGTYQQRQQPYNRYNNRQQGGYNNRYNNGGYNRYNNGGYNRYNNQGAAYQKPVADGAEAAGAESSDNQQPQAQQGYQPRPYNNRPKQGYQPRPYNNRQQQGGYNNGPRQQGGYNNRQQQGGYNNRQQQGGYNNGPRQQGGYNNRQQQGGYNNGPRQQGGYNNRQQQGGYNNGPRQQGGYNNRQQQGGYNNGPRQQGGYNNRQQGGYNNRYGMPRSGKSFTPRPKPVEYEMPVPDPDEQIRLNKYMANAGICSRREADEFIKQGLVKINGEVVTELGTKISHSDTVEYDEKIVTLERKCYILLNKPKDCVTTSDDPNGRLTVLDLVKGACNERIYPVGRLDRNTTGVLLLTNDGDLASKLTHPKYVKKKIYHVWTDKDISEDDMQRIADGIELDDGPIQVDAISYATETDRNQAGIEIHSGRNRIVRRIFESLGYHVTKLDRVYFAGLTKKNLPRGRWRYLTQEEVNFLKMGSFE